MYGDILDRILSKRDEVDEFIEKALEHVEPSELINIIHRICEENGWI